MDSSAYTLKVISPRGHEVARIIPRPFEPEPVTETVREAYEKRLAGARRAVGGTACSRMLMVVGAAQGNNPGPATTFELENLLPRGPGPARPGNHVGGPHLGATPRRGTG